MNENRRIATVRSYKILDTPNDVAFDRITKLVSKVLQTPIAVITIIDTDRVWFKSTTGIDLTEMDRNYGFCSNTIKENDLFVVEDARNDEQAKNNELVTSEFGLQFYAGVPLTVENGENIGTLCIIDQKPRILSADEKQLLKEFALLATEQIELQYSVKQSNDKQLEMANMLQSIYSSTQEASTFIDTDLKIRYSNQAAKNITKQIFGKEEEIGDDAMEYVLPQFKKEFEDSFQAVLKGNCIKDEKTDGTNWWLISMYPVYNKENTIVGLAHNVHNITKDKNNLLKLTKQNQLLRKITWQQCHEVRGPVANILGFCGLLRDNPELNAEEWDTYTNHLYDAAKNLDKIIHQIVTQSILHFKEV